MNRVEIKELAKSKIKGNLWNLLWPLLVIGVLQSICQKIFLPSVNIDITNLESLASFSIPTGYYIGSAIISIVFAIIYACYAKYVLDFSRSGKFDTNVIVETFKKRWLQIIIAEILTSIIIGVCSMLFVIPGIIMSLAYTFVTLLVVDTDVQGSDSLKKGREMMKAYKLDYFVFQLSFIGWYLLVPFTLGILLIWLVPYINVANSIYYDKLKEKTNN